MAKKIKIISIIVAVVAILAVVGIILFKKFAPSFVKRDMAEQYSELAEGETLVVVDGEVLDVKGKMVSGAAYLPMDLVVGKLGCPIYWDEAEGVMSLTTSTDLIRVSISGDTGVTDYVKGGQTISMDSQILYVDGDMVYILLDFVKDNSRINCEVFNGPSRIIIESDFESEFEFAKLSEETNLRVGPGKKYEYLLKLAKDQNVRINAAVQEEKGYVGILTMDGIAGYVPQELIAGREKKKQTTDKKLDEFAATNPGFSQKVCIGWHQMSAEDGNANLQTVAASAKSMNVIIPTWMSLKGKNGDYTSFCDKTYVDNAHNMGLKVWALIDDFGKNISLKEILGKTSSRSNLIKKLMADCDTYGFDGINVDFEKITKGTVTAYLEFLRELKLECSKKGKVVTVDNYVPTAATSYYNWEEEGRVVDYVIFMAYDEHYSKSKTAGSVSSLDFVKNGLKKGLEYVKPERIVVALPFYTRLWRVKSAKSDKVMSSAVYGMSGAESVLSAHDTTAKWDDKTGQYYAAFKSETADYKIWLEEETSLEKKLEVAFESKVGGVAFWRLGFERPVTWSIISKYIK